MPWKEVLREKISEIELLASWASRVNYSTVRDHLLKAADELREELARRKEHDLRSDRVWP